MDDPITLAVCTDENYALYAAMALRSAAFSLSEKQKIEAYFIDCGVEPATRKRVERALEVKSLDLNWKHVDTTNFSHLQHSSWTSRAAFARLCIPYLIPNEKSHFIYLDSDLFLRKNISNLWKLRDDKNIVCACRDYKYPYVKNAKAKEVMKELGMSESDKYFNSGLLLVNKEEWKRERISAKVCYLSDKFGERFTHKDQDPLNIAINGRWKEVDRKWNVTTHEFRSSERNYYSAFGVHFTESKPDQKNCRHELKREYLLFVLGSNYFENFEKIKWISKIASKRYKSYIGSIKSKLANI